MDENNEKYNKSTEEFQKLAEEYALDLFGDVQCLARAHFDGQSSCKAFERIPPEIWLGGHDHTKPYPGNNGLRFKARDDKA